MIDRSRLVLRSSIAVSFFMIASVVFGRELSEDINLFTPAETKNSAGIHFPAYQGRAVKWIDLSTHRSGLPRLPDNLPVVDLVDPYRDYDSKKAAAFLKGFKPTHKPGQLQEYSNIGTAGHRFETPPKADRMLSVGSNLHSDGERR